MQLAHVQGKDDPVSLSVPQPAIQRICFWDILKGCTPSDVHHSDFLCIQTS